MPLLAAALLSYVAAQSGQGGRYGLDRFYDADVTATMAWLLWSGLRRGEFGPGNAVFVDVRTVEEFAEGHVPGSVNVPFPRVHGSGPDDPAFVAQDELAFLEAVRGRLGAGVDAVALICRSGSRSVAAGNVLATGAGGRGAPLGARVFNVWEGMQGVHRVNGEGAALDLNGDGAVDDLDRDGWANALGLPTSNALHPWAVWDPEQRVGGGAGGGGGGTASSGPPLTDASTALSSPSATAAVTPDASSEAREARASPGATVDGDAVEAPSSDPTADVAVALSAVTLAVNVLCLAPGLAVAVFGVRAMQRTVGEVLFLASSGSGGTAGGKGARAGGKKAV